MCSSCSQNEIKIVSLEKANASDLAWLEAECFDAPWKIRDFELAFGLPYFSAYGLLCQDRLAAYLSFNLLAPELEILNLGTSPVFRRQGHAARLLGHLQAKMPELGAETAFLEVRQHNEAAIKLYAKAGFARYGLRQAYYRDNGEDAILLRYAAPKPLS